MPCDGTNHSVETPPGETSVAVRGCIGYGGQKHRSTAETSTGFDSLDFPEKPPDLIPDSSLRDGSESQNTPTTDGGNDTVDINPGPCRYITSPRLQLVLLISRRVKLIECMYSNVHIDC